MPSQGKQAIGPYGSFPFKLASFLQVLKMGHKVKIVLLEMEVEFRLCGVKPALQYLRVKPLVLEMSRFKREHHQREPELAPQSVEHTVNVEQGLLMEDWKRGYFTQLVWSLVHVCRIGGKSHVRAFHKSPE